MTEYQDRCTLPIFCEELTYGKSVTKVKLQHDGAYLYVCPIEITFTRIVEDLAFEVDAKHAIFTKIKLYLCHLC